MAWLRPYYVYLILSPRGFYVGKGCEDRVKESKKERHGFGSLIISRHFTQRSAYRAEIRWIRLCRSLMIPLQNGRAPRRSVWRRFLPRSRKRKRASSIQVAFGLAICVSMIWWLCV